MLNTIITLSKYELEGVKTTCEMLDNYFACVFKKWYSQRTMDLIKKASSDDACVIFLGS